MALDYAWELALFWNNGKCTKMKTSKHMDKDNDNDFSSLAEDARALLAATADVASDKVAEARKRVAAALESGGKMLTRVRDQAVEGAKATDQAIRDNPYKSLAIAFSVGAILGYLISRRGRD